MFKSKSKSQEWSQWFQKVKAKRNEIRTYGDLGEAREMRSSARYGLDFTTEKVAGTLPLSFQNSLANPVREQSHEVMEHLDKMLVSARFQGRGSFNVREYQALQKDMRAATQRLEDARAIEDEILAERDRLGVELAELEAAAPKASASTLKVMVTELEEAQAERDRIQFAIDNLEADNGTLDKAKQEAEDAAAQLEEAEALAALGEANPEDVKAAGAASAKARVRAEKHATELRRVEAARRGLCRKLEDVTALTHEIDAAYKQAVIQVHSAALADAEARFMEHVSGDGLRGLLAEMAKHHAALSDAHEEGSFGPARVEIKLPVLYQYPDHSRLSHDRLEILPT